MAFLEQDQVQFDRMKHLVIGAIIGAALLAGIGALWPGWNLESTTRDRIAIAERAATIQAFGSVCAEKILARPDTAILIAKLKTAKPWERMDVFTKGDDARLVKMVTMPGSPDPNAQLANRCAELVAPTLGAVAQ